MATSVQTRGHQVQVMPAVQFADPRLFSGAADAAFGGIRSGMGVASQLQNLLAASEAIREEREVRPIRRGLLEAQLASAPLTAELARIQLNEAREAAALPRFVTGDIDIIDKSILETPALGEDGQPTGEPEVVIGDLVKRTKRKQIVNGQLVDAEPLLEVFKPAAVRKAEAEKEAANIEAVRALAKSRLTGKETETERTIRLLQESLADGDNEAAELYKARLARLSTQPGILPSGTAYTRRVEQLAADAGVPLERALEMAKTDAGAKQLSDLAVAAKAAARNPLTAFAPRPSASAAAPVDDILAEVESAMQAQAEAPASSVIPSFATEEDANKAARAGRIKKGQRIRIGNQTGTWQ